MYLTAQDEIAIKLFQNDNPNMSDIVRDLIENHKKSDVKKSMQEGQEYYEFKHRILNHEFNVSKVDGETVTNEDLSNEKLVHGFPHLLVRQKIDYIAGKDIDIKYNSDNETEAENGVSAVKDVLGDYYMTRFRKWATNASNKGVEYLHFYIQNNELKYVVIDAREIIPVYDGAFEEELTGIMRYYPVTVKSTKHGQPVTRYKVELWGKDQVLYLMEADNDDYIKDPDVKGDNPRHHFYVGNTAFPDERQGKGWGELPFIELKNNELGYSDLKLYKTLVDNYDFNRSDLSNQLRDMQELFWLVFTDDAEFKISEFIKNVKKYKGAAAPDGAKVDPKKGEIPNQARKEHSDKLFEDIFIFGMGVNLFSFDIVKNPPSGIALKIMFTGLELKTNALIQHWNLAFREVFWFVCEYLKMTGKGEYDYTKFKPVFNKSIIVNEKELIDMINLSKDDLSRETRLEKNPLIDDVAKELERLEKEESEYVENYRTQITDGNNSDD